MYYFHLGENTAERKNIQNSVAIKNTTYVCEKKKKITAENVYE